MTAGFNFFPLHSKFISPVIIIFSPSSFFLSLVVVVADEVNKVVGTFSSTNC